MKSTNSDPPSSHPTNTPTPQAAYTFTAQRAALLQGGVHIPHSQLLAAAAAQAEAAARAMLLTARGLPAPVVDAILQGRLSRRLGLMLSPPAAATTPAPAAPAPQPAPAAQDKSALLKQMLFGAGGGGGSAGGLGLGLGLGNQQPPQQQQQSKNEDREVARVLQGMAQEEAAAAARRRRWKAPLLFEWLRGSYELETGDSRPGAGALTRRLRALLYGLAGVEGVVREEALLADDTCVLYVFFVLCGCVRGRSMLKCQRTDHSHKTGRWWRWRRCRCCSGRPSWTGAGGKVCLWPDE
jgi:hypothetical protein